MTPLSGNKVLTVEIGAAGPWCSRQLADMGAEVVKVEPRTGDVSRHWDGVANGLSVAHRNKKSLALDLKSDEGREIFLKLAAGANAIVENFKPGAVARLGIGYEEVHAVKPDIVYGHISGFGQDGPYRDEKAYDMIIQGEAGYIMMTGTPEEPAKIPISICDEAAGFYAALGTLGLLNRRHETGEGGEFEVSMLECAASMLGYAPDDLQGGLAVRPGRALLCRIQHGQGASVGRRPLRRRPRGADPWRLWLCARIRYRALFPRASAAADRPGQPEDSV